MSSKVSTVLMVVMFAGAVLAAQVASAATMHEFLFDNSSNRGQDTGTGTSVPLSANGATFGSVLTGMNPNQLDQALIDAAGESIGQTVPSTASISTMGMTDAFTLESIVKLSTITNSSNQHILSLDNASGGGISTRPWTFVVNTSGEIAFTTIYNIVSYGLAGGLATIPTTGDHAWNADDWFHVAFTYDGTGGGGDGAHTQLYWTKLDTTAPGANTTANALTTTRDMEGDIPGTKSGSFTVGNLYSSDEAYPLMGYIDRVRVHNVALGAGDFDLPDPIPEPSSLIMLVIGSLLLALWRWRR